MSADVKFGEWIDRGFTLYKENFGLLVLSSLVAGLISVFTLGILAGPMMIGLILIMLALHDKTEPKPELNKLFEGFQFFLPAFLYLLIVFVALLIANKVLSVLPCVGAPLFLVLSVALTTFLIFTPFLIADQKLDFWSAMQVSAEKIKQNFWPYLGLTVVSNIIGALGGILCGIGAIFTAPIAGCILTVAYRESFNGGSVTQEPPLEDLSVSGGDAPEDA